MAMNLRLPETLDHELHAAADDEGRSMQQIVVTAISDYLERKQQREIKAIFGRIAERDAHLLARLADS